MFSEHTSSEGPVYLTSSVLPAVHAFSTRLGGISRNGFETFNISVHRGDEPDAVRENYRRWCTLFSSGVDDCCVTDQVHGNYIQTVTSKDKHACLANISTGADGLVTGEKHLPIFCFTADCVPVLLYDLEGHAAGAVHCGWRSSAADILNNAVTAMQSLGAIPQNICAALGPSIGSCCFETDQDVPDALHAYLHGDSKGLWVKREDGKYMVDLRKANARRLLQLGLLAEHIDLSDACTMCHPDKFWSARYTFRHHQVRGSMVAGIML